MFCEPPCIYSIFFTLISLPPPHYLTGLSTYHSIHDNPVMYRYTSGWMRVLDVLEFYILSLNFFLSLKSPCSFRLIKYSTWNVLELHLLYWNLVKFNFKLSLGHQIRWLFKGLVDCVQTYSIFKYILCNMKGSETSDDG